MYTVVMSCACPHWSFWCFPLMSFACIASKLAGQRFCLKCLLKIFLFGLGHQTQPFCCADLFSRSRGLDFCYNSGCWTQMEPSAVTDAGLLCWESYAKISLRLEPTRFGCLEWLECDAWKCFRHWLHSELPKHTRTLISAQDQGWTLCLNHVIWLLVAAN